MIDIYHYTKHKKTKGHVRFLVVEPAFKQLS